MHRGIPPGGPITPPAPFETHLTLHPDASRDVAALRRAAADLGLKLTHILLDHGRSPSQPMLTRHATGTLDAELAAARSLATTLSDRGLPVARIKIETTPAHPDALPSPTPDCYFEHHVKLLLPTDPPPPDLAALAAQHAAHLSRNALRTRPDGQHERFLTQRFHHLGRPAARARLDALLSALTSAGHTILDVEEEYVLYDSNLSLDVGWLDPTPE